MSDEVHPSGLRVRTPDLARSRPPRFAWHGRILLGYLNLLLGNEGVGKGVLVSWIIARLTLGELPGDLEGNPATVAILADEDSFDDVWTPRIYAAGADLDHVRHIDRADGWSVDLTEDREKLRLAAELEGVQFLYLDQLLDNLGVGVDDWRGKQVRHALQPVRAIAAEFQIAALGSLHPNKRGDTFRQLVSGASAFNAVSRSSLLLAEHPDDDRRRVLVRGKGNLSTTPAAVEFDIASARFTSNGYSFNVPHAVDIAESDLAIDDLIQTAPPPAAPAGAARTAARDLINDALSDGEWHEAGPIITQCAQHDVHERAARRAARDIGIDQEKRGFPAASWWRRQNGQPVRSAHTVRSVRTVRSVDPALDRSPDSTDTTSARADRQDRQDRPHTRKNPVRTAPDPDTELARITAKFGTPEAVNP